MKDKELFQKAIGMDPWVVVSYEFDPDKGRLDLELDFPPGHTFVCPECNTEGRRVYDTERKSWRHLNFFQYEAYLHARVPRVDCRKCESFPPLIGQLRGIIKVHLSRQLSPFSFIGQNRHFGRLDSKFEALRGPRSFDLDPIHIKPLPQ